MDTRPRRFLALGAGLAAALCAAGTAAQPAGPGWALTQVTPADRGTVGARWPALSGAGSDLAFPFDGALPGAAGMGNADNNAELFLWQPGGVTQVTATQRQGNVTPAQSQPSVARDGRRVAFTSSADLVGTNADQSLEVYVWDAGAGFVQVSRADAGGAEGPSLSADGAWVFFWHSADLTGDNPGGGLELFRARVGGPELDQLTALSGTPYHEAPSAAGDGSAVAFIAEADLAGANADGSWELFLWRAPVSSPGDPARFEQVTDWRPPLTGREIYSASLDQAGRRVAFAGRGQVDVTLPEDHQELEIYLWSGAGTLRRLTTATRQNASSLLPRIAGDGRAVSFVSLSDFAPTAPGNADRDQELFLWSECRPIEQVTASTGRSAVTANVPELRPSVDAGGRVAAFVSERADDAGPLALPSRRGICFRAAADDAAPCPAAPSPTTPPSPTVPPPTATRAPSATPAPPATPGAGQVCPSMAARIPAAVQAQALANPSRVYGWNLPQNPGLAPGPRNPPRRWLSLRDPGKPYGPGNPVVWKVGCP